MSLLDDLIKIQQQNFLSGFAQAGKAVKEAKQHERVRFLLDELKTKEQSGLQTTEEQIGEVNDKLATDPAVKAAQSLYKTANRLEGYSKLYEPYITEFAKLGDEGVNIANTLKSRMDSAMKIEEFRGEIPAKQMELEAKDLQMRAARQQIDRNIVLFGREDKTWEQAQEDRASTILADKLFAEIKIQSTFDESTGQYNWNVNDLHAKLFSQYGNDPSYSLAMAKLIKMLKEQTKDYDSSKTANLDWDRKLTEAEANQQRQDNIRKIYADMTGQVMYLNQLILPNVFDGNNPLGIKDDARFNSRFASWSYTRKYNEIAKELYANPEYAKQANEPIIFGTDKAVIDNMPTTNDVEKAAKDAAIWVYNNFYAPNATYWANYEMLDAMMKDETTGKPKHLWDKEREDAGGSPFWESSELGINTTKLIHKDYGWYNPLDPKSIETEAERRARYAREGKFIDKPNNNNMGEWGGAATDKNAGVVVMEELPSVKEQKKKEANKSANVPPPPRDTTTAQVPKDLDTPSQNMVGAQIDISIDDKEFQNILVNGTNQGSRSLGKLDGGEVMQFFYTTPEGAEVSFLRWTKAGQKPIYYGYRGASKEEYFSSKPIKKKSSDEVSPVSPPNSPSSLKAKAKSQLDEKLNEKRKRLNNFTLSDYYDDYKDDYANIQIAGGETKKIITMTNSQGEGITFVWDGYKSTNFAKIKPKANPPSIKSKIGQPQSELIDLIPEAKASPKPPEITGTAPYREGQSPAEREMTKAVDTPVFSISLTDKGTEKEIDTKLKEFTKWATPEKVKVIAGGVPMDELSAKAPNGKVTLHDMNLTKDYYQSKANNFYNKYREVFGDAITDITTIVGVESGYEPTNVSKTGATGLFQWTRGTWNSTREYINKKYNGLADKLNIPTAEGREGKIARSDEKLNIVMAVALNELSNSKFGTHFEALWKPEKGVKANGKGISWNLAHLENKDYNFKMNVEETANYIYKNVIRKNG